MNRTLELETRRAMRLSGLARCLEADLASARRDSASIETALAQLATEEPSEDVRAALDDIFGFAPARSARPARHEPLSVPAGMRA